MSNLVPDMSNLLGVRPPQTPVGQPADNHWTTPGLSDTPHRQ